MIFKLLMQEAMLFGTFGGPEQRAGIKGLNFKRFQSYPTGKGFRSPR